MLDPDIVIDAIVLAIQSIPDIIAEMGGSMHVNDLVTGHKYSSGTENSITKTVMQMPQPSILVAYDSLLGGNFNGETIHKHRLQIWLRSANRQTDSFEGVNPPSTLPHLWWLIMNRPVYNGQFPNLRYATLLNGSLSLMETPTMQIRTDETNSDLIVGTCVFPEMGDDL